MMFNCADVSVFSIFDHKNDLFLLCLFITGEANKMHLPRTKRNEQVQGCVWKLLALVDIGIRRIILFTIKDFSTLVRHLLKSTPLKAAVSSVVGSGK